MYAGQLLKLRELLMNSRMAIYIDERTLAEVAKTREGEEIEAEESDEDDDELDFLQERAKPAKKKECMKTVKIHECVRLATVDNFQGEEAEVVLISTVRCNDRGNTGFLKISNRVNVMMSRAKHGMYVFGSSDTIMNSKQAAVFNCMLADFQTNKRIGDYIPVKCSRHTTQFHIKTPKDFESLVPDGGCNVPCGTRLLCGHACPRMCHPDDANHLGAKCNEPCVRLHKPCGHPCVKVCHQDCGKCMKLPCGHYKNVHCHQTITPESIFCPYKVEATYPLCAHTCIVTCDAKKSLQQSIEQFAADGSRRIHNNDPLFGCAQKCNSTLPCGHICNLPCGKCCAETVSGEKSFPLAIVRKNHSRTSCTSPCNKPLLCGHSCMGVCHEPSECSSCSLKCVSACPHSRCDRKCVDACASCLTPCTWRCAHKGACPLPCSSPCVRLPCDERCDKMLACGHPCPSVCGEVCPTAEIGCTLCASVERKAAVVEFTSIYTLDLRSIL